CSRTDEWQPAAPAGRASVALGESSLSHGVGELLEHRDGVLPAHAGIRDALAVHERLARLEILPAGDEMALDHQAEDPVVPSGDLAGDVLDHADLVLVLLAAVAVAGVDHQPAG